MVDPAAGDHGLSVSSALAAAEAARQAALDAARRAAELAAQRAAEAAKALAARLAEARMHDRLEIAEPPGIYGNRPVAAFSRPPLQEAPPPAPADPPPPAAQTVLVEPGTGVRGIVADWATTGGLQLGMRDPLVYEEYMSTHEHTLLGVARGIAGTQPGPEAMGTGVQAGDQLTAPAIDYLAEQNPGATFEVIGVEYSSLSGMGGVEASNVVIAMTQAGETEPQYFAVAAPQTDPTLSIQNAIAQDPAIAAQWQESMTERLDERGLLIFEDPAQTMNYAVAYGGSGLLTEGVTLLPSEMQASFYQNLAGQYLIPVDPPLADDIIVSAPVVAEGSSASSVATDFRYDNIDGLAGSTALPLPEGMDASTWRTALAGAQAAAPTSMADLETALLASGMTTAEIDALRASDPGALPAVFALTAAGPDVTFERDLQFTLTAENAVVTYETALVEGVERTVAVVDTSVNQLLAGTDRAAELGPTYAVADVPMTVRIPLPLGQTVLEDEAAMLEVLNGQLQGLPTADVFLHGYQSTREVWTPDMQTWMNLSGGDTIGIAFAGMGSEGNQLGTGQNPFTPRQYAFQTMEALDALGLYGKELNVIGHSMGGAAGLHIGLTMDAMGGANPPDMRYVLLAPAVGPDSVPFLTEGGYGFLINTQNGIGTSWASGLAQFGNWLAGGAVVGGLIPGAPDYIQDVHSGFAGEYGFEQLAATARGLMSQGYVDPALVRAFMAQNQVLVVAAGQDQLVDPAVVQRVFGDEVVTVDGNHYAHLGNSSDPAAAGSPALILDLAEDLLNAPILPRVRPGGGGGGRMLVY